MYSINIIPKDLEITHNNLPSSKVGHKDSNRDFSQILENQKEKQKIAKATDKVHEKPIQNLNKPKVEKKLKVSEEEHIEKDELNDTNETIDEILMLLYSLCNLIEELEINTKPDELNKLKLDFLDFTVLENVETSKELYSQFVKLLDDLTKNDNLIFESQNISEITEGIEKVFLLFENEIEKNKLINEENQEEIPIKENISQLKETLNHLKAIITNRSKFLVENTMEMEKDLDINQENFQNLVNTEKESKEIIEEKDFAIKDEEVSIENLEEKDIEIKDMENNNPVFKIKDSAIIKEIPNEEIQTTQDINNKEVIKQIVDKAKLIVDDFKQEIKIKLKPEILGELMLKMEVQKESVLAKIMVDNYRTKELIEANLYQLKQDMKENGLEIKTFEVFVGSNEDFERENRQEFNFKRKLAKFKIKNKEIKEIQMYDENTLNNVQNIYEEGSLNLFA